MLWLPALHIAQEGNREQLVTLCHFPTEFSLYYLGGNMKSVGLYMCNRRHNVTFGTFATVTDTSKMKVTGDVQVPDQVWKMHSLSKHSFCWQLAAFFFHDSVQGTGAHGSSRQIPRQLWHSLAHVVPSPPVAVLLGTGKLAMQMWAEVSEQEGFSLGVNNVGLVLFCSFSVLPKIWELPISTQN